MRYLFALYFGMSYNKWRWWMQTAAAFSGGLTIQVGWLGAGLAANSVLSLHSSNDLAELSPWLAMMIAP